MSAETKTVQLVLPINLKYVAQKKLELEEQSSVLDQIASMRSQIALLFHENRKIQKRLDSQLEVFKAQATLIAQEEEINLKQDMKLDEILNVLLDK